MALWYPWDHMLPDAENMKAAADLFAQHAHVRWRHPPLRRILKLTRREIARVAKADRPTAKSCGRTVQLRRVIRSYAWA